MGFSTKMVHILVFSRYGYKTCHSSSVQRVQGSQDVRTVLLDMCQQKSPQGFLAPVRVMKCADCDERNMLFTKNVRGSLPPIYSLATVYFSDIKIQKGDGIGVVKFMLGLPLPLGIPFPQCHQGDCHGHQWKRWTLPSTSPVMTRAVIQTTLPFQWSTLQIHWRQNTSNPLHMYGISPQWTGVSQ